MREVSALDFDKGRLELFDRLVVPEEEGRVSAAKQLADYCAEDQKQHEADLGKKAKAGKVVKPEDEVCSLAAYSCRRLIRGMSSGRGSARQGFGLALCEKEPGARWHVVTFGSHGDYARTARQVCAQAVRHGADNC